MFILVEIATGTFDSDWHKSYEAAAWHASNCGLRAGWYVAEITAAQAAQIYAV